MTRFTRTGVILSALLTVAAASAAAQTAAPAAQGGTPAPAAKAADTIPNFFRDIQANAFLSLGYLYNLNNPVGNVNGLRIFDGVANSFSVDVAELVLQKPVANPGDAGFRVDLEAGSAIPGKEQSAGLSIGTGADLQQAFVSYIAPIGSGVRFDAGKFVTHLGLELIEGYDGYNDNYSRSLLFNYAIPLTHTGVKGSYTINSKASAMLMVVNGWDNAVDNNKSKSVGAQLALTPVAPLSVYLNYMGGPEQTNNNSANRQIFDAIAVWKATDAVTLSLNGDYGTEAGASTVTAGKDAVWKGIAGYGKLAVNSNVSLALRGETFKDEGGTRLGLGNATASEITFTPAYQFTKNFLVRAEGRYDTVNQDGAFVDDKGAAKRSQSTIGLNAIFVF
ncbi:MAG TPA: porin [Thermoanaerobaculia bacterium]